MMLGKFRPRIAVVCDPYLCRLGVDGILCRWPSKTFGERLRIATDSPNRFVPIVDDQTREKPDKERVRLPPRGPRDGGVNASSTNRV